MRLKFILLILFLSFSSSLRAQKSNIFTAKKLLREIISYYFGNKSFEIDSINFYEGYVFYIKPLKDSSYFRINNIPVDADFECCSEKSIYIENNKTSTNGRVDRSGKVISTNLFWREIKSSDMQFVYNNCTLEELKKFNSIIDSTCKKIYYNKK
jgi:hypothetical protein